MTVQAKHEGYTAVIIGTGPSLTDEQIETIDAYRRTHGSKIRVFGVNNVYQKIQCDVFYACNHEWWDYYHPGSSVLRKMLKDGHTEAWTHVQATAAHYGVNYIEGRWSGGKRNVTSLSTDPEYIHYGHGSGYEVCGLAYLYGCRNFILVGYDLTFGSGYDAKSRIATEDRHFFGEYPKQLQHWPGRSGKNVDPETGEIIGLLDCYRTIDCDRLGLRIVNCSPGSALDFFKAGDLEKELYEIYRTQVPLD